MFLFYNNAAAFTTINPAVSVLSRCTPRLRFSYFFLWARPTSVSVKSPSGPIRISVDLFSNFTSRISFFLPFPHQAMNFCSASARLMKSENFTASLIEGMLAHYPFVLKNFRAYFSNIYRRKILRTNAPFLSLFSSVVDRDAVDHGGCQPGSLCRPFPVAPIARECRAMIVRIGEIARNPCEAVGGYQRSYIGGRIGGWPKAKLVGAFDNLCDQLVLAESTAVDGDFDGGVAAYFRHS